MFWASIWSWCRSPLVRICFQNPGITTRFQFASCIGKAATEKTGRLEEMITRLSATLSLKNESPWSDNSKIRRPLGASEQGMSYLWSDLRAWRIATFSRFRDALLAFVLQCPTLYMRGIHATRIDWHWERPPSRNPPADLRTRGHPITGLCGTAGCRATHQGLGIRSCSGSDGQGPSAGPEALGSRSAKPPLRRMAGRETRHSTPRGHSTEPALVPCS